MITAIKAIILHTFGVQVGLRAKGHQSCAGTSDESSYSGEAATSCWVAVEELI